MLDSPLPHTVNTRKAVIRKARYAGTVGAGQLPSLSDVLASGNDACVLAEVVFSRDEENRQIVTVCLKADVLVECQRCMERFAQTLDSKSELAIVRTDEEASLLSERYEPLIGAEDTDLWEIVAEELALVLPVVSYHPDKCPETRMVPEVENDTEDGTVHEADRPNPFEVLSVLLQEGTQNSEEE
jgi:uncharacterized protein